MKHEPTPTGTPAAEELLTDYEPVTLSRQRHDGWTAERQREFLTTLAETGCISEACLACGLSARSAYRLRAHPDGAAFAVAWDKALRSAAGKLVTLAYERAVRGAVREIWRDGQLVAEYRAPSEKLLMFLINRLVPCEHASRDRWLALNALSLKAGNSLDEMLADLDDSDVPADALSYADFHAAQPQIGDKRIQPLGGRDSG